MKAFWIMGAALALTACATAGAQTADPTLSALKAAKLVGCPAGSIQQGARTSGETVRSGITETELARTPLTNDSVGRNLRVRRLVFAPGAVLQWHDHKARQGLSMLASGELVEYRGDCRDPITHKAGDLIDEGATAVHWWRNESKAEAVIFVFDAPPPA